MSSESYPLRQSGIYRNLPTFDPNISGLGAAICGASGISGFNTLRILLESPERWSAIYSLSRSPIPDSQLALLTDQQRARIHHVSIDLSSNGAQIAEQLKRANVQADYLFYYSYLEPKQDSSGRKLSAMDPAMAEELVKTNVPLFKNMLDALPQAGLTPKRILLQTGGKNYGMHIGRVRTPLVESDPQPTHLSPNFYYEQERLLFEYCNTHTDTHWNIVMPAGVIGAVANGAMNSFFPFGVYAATQARKGEPLVFGGDFAQWQFESASSTARLMGYLSEWAVLEEKCQDQRFNAQDGSPFSFDRFFHELARWFGVEAGVKAPEEGAEYKHNFQLPGGEKGPLGYGPDLDMKKTFTLEEWASESRNRETWRTLMDESGGQLTTDPFEEDTSRFFMGDFVYTPFGTLSMNKVRRFGFNGFVDSFESIFEAFKEFEKYGMLPAAKADAAQPMI